MSGKNMSAALCASAMGVSLLVGATSVLAQGVAKPGNNNGVGNGYNTHEASQFSGLGGWEVEPLFTVGESVDDYQPVGILDGIGAVALDFRTVRVFVSHELTDEAGYPYAMANGLEITGARVSYFDINKNNRKIVGAGLAYDTIVDRAGNVVTTASQINEGNRNVLTDGIDRLCSSYLAAAAYTNFEDDIYFTGEETGEGQEFALDVANRVLHCAPMLGRAAWESVTSLDTGDPNTVAIVIGDDRAPAPLTLYVGQKNAIGDNSFLDRNGLAVGNLYVWVADNGDIDPSQWNGTGTSRSGTFVQIQHYDAAMANMPGYDALGFAKQATQDAMSAAVNAFKFSRPEDVATNPADRSQVVLASTGRSRLFGGADSWGTTYIIDVDFSDFSADISIVYDGDDAGAGQVAGPDYGLRSPDNLDWAADGMIYVQEDRSVGGFGQTSGEEASIFMIDPVTGVLTRIGQVDRSAIPANQVDVDPNDLGGWETSGILDVTHLFTTVPGERLLIMDVQAHSLRGPGIVDPNLVQGGQLSLLSFREWPKDGGEEEALVAVLDQNSPNPFNPGTMIRFELRSAGNVSLKVYNVAGQLVRTLTNRPYGVGFHNVEWNGLTDTGIVASSGVYFYRLQVGNFVETKSMILMK